MKTPKSNEVAAQIENEFLQATDDAGNPIADIDVIEHGHKPQRIKFRAAGQNHVAEVIFAQIPFAVRQAPNDWARRFMVANGITGQEDIENDPEALEKTERIERELLNHPERLKLRAEVAVAALARDAAGRYRISVPQFRDLVRDVEGKTSFLAHALCEDAVFGRAVINAICAEVDAFFTS